MFPPSADSALMDRVALDMSSAPPAVAMSAMRNAFRYSDRVATRLGELNLPVVAINAELFPTDTASLGRHQVQLLMMPEVGHFLQMEEPARFNELLRTALARFPE
jgi:pimeloyl-ACP methyl ester carboxylesterase